MRPFLDEMPIGRCSDSKSRCRSAVSRTTPSKYADFGTQNLIRRAIDKSFVSGFRCVMAIGAALAVASAVTAVVSIQRERG
jgi:hypothetical protein